MKTLLFAVSVALCASANATTYYFADCGTGKDPACVIGNDGNSGTSPTTPYRTSAKFQVVFDNLTINGFGWGGWGCAGQAGYGYPSLITLRNSTITNSGKTGIASFGCSNLVVENNILNNNGFDDQQIATSQDIIRNHPIY